MTENINTIPTQEDLKTSVTEAIDDADQADWAAKGQSGLYHKSAYGKGMGRRYVEMAGNVAGEDLIKATKSSGHRIDANIRRHDEKGTVVLDAYTYEATDHEKVHGFDKDRSRTTLRRYDSKLDRIKTLETENPLVARIVGKIAAEGAKKQARESIEKSKARAKISQNHKKYGVRRVGIRETLLAR